MKMTVQRVGLMMAVLVAFQGWNVSVGAAPPELTPALQKAIKNMEATVEPSTAGRGQTVTWRLTIDLADGWHTYPLKQTAPDAEDYVDTFHFPVSTDFVFVGPVQEPPTTSFADAGLVLRVLEGKVVWERSLVVAPGATPGTKTVTVKMTGQVCNRSGCLPFLRSPLTLEAPLTVTSADPVPVDPRFKNEVSGAGAHAAIDTGTYRVGLGRLLSAPMGLPPRPHSPRPLSVGTPF